ncbi:MAG: sigma 54-interacting transcriptional regulator [Desulfobacterales bacterium]|nr:sigma 54-interacting transcriptional regulator [Desulfobacterales bacterium]
MTVQGTEFSVACKLPRKKKFLLKTISGSQIPGYIRERTYEEFKVANGLGIDDILCPTSVIDTENVVGIAYPDAHLVPLSLAVKKGRRPLFFALETAFKVSKILSALHKGGHVHNALSPDTVWIDPDGEGLKLMGGGHSFDQAHSPTPEESSGMPYWLYKSPEQAGRLHARIDKRTDFYSLGAVLFFVLAGKPPFLGKDALELIHNHMARPVPDLKAICPDIPDMVVAVVNKLMEKSPDNRYQSADSLVVDLKRCLSALEVDGTIPQFRLDVLKSSHLFEYPEKLFGRDGALNRLLLSFDQVVNNQGALTMITGGSGVGKTTLVRHFEERLPRDQGYFAGGKCEYANSSIPYSGIIGALGEIAHCILMEADGAYGKISKSLAESLGENRGVITQLVPQFKPILGEDAPVAGLQMLESRNRLHQCIRKIIHILCEHKSFLVIFIDDLQWVDQASMDLICSIVSGREQGLFFIGAHRNNGVDSGHILNRGLVQVEGFRPAVDTLLLEDLEQDDVQGILTEALKLGARDMVALARVVHGKTNGTPLMVKEFIELLVREKYVRLNRRMAWEFDLEEIIAIGINTDIDLLTCRKLGRLPEDVRHTIFIAAAIGNSFHIKDLVIHEKSSLETIDAHLRAACRKNVLVSLGKGRYRFEHDRLQENAYKMIPEKARTKIHLRLGKSFEKGMDKNRNRIFEHITHLNTAHHLASSHKERAHLARLNFVAGGQAKKVAAFTEAFQYFSKGIEILGARGWEDHYDLCLGLSSQGAVAAYLSGHFQSSDTLALDVIDRGKTEIDRALGYEAQMEAAIFQNKTDLALTILLKALETLGVSLSIETTVPQARAEMDTLRPVARELLMVPCHGVSRSRDPKYQAIMRLLLQGAKATGWIDYPLYWNLVGNMLKITQAHGFFEESVFGLIASGGSFCHLLGAYDLGIRLAEYGMEYMEVHHIRKCSLDARIYFHEEITCLRDHPETAVTQLTALYYQAIETGNISMAIESAHAACLIGLFGNMGLMELEQLSLKFEEILSVSFPGIKPLQSNLKMINVLVQALLSPQPGDLVNATLDANEYRSNKELTLNIRLFLNILFSNCEAAQGDVDALLPYGCNFVMIPTRFYLLITLLNREKQGGDNGIIEELKAELEELRGASQDNYAHRFHLIQAEEERLKGDYGGALHHYDQSIVLARERRFILDEAMALEFTARFLTGVGAEHMARNYVAEAHRAYEKWGCRAKINQLEHAHPFLSGGATASVPQTESALMHRALKNQQANTMDMGSIHRAVVTLVSAMDGFSLLEELMGILLQNSGAERGYLLSRRNNAIVVESHVCVEEGADPVDVGATIESCPCISHSIVRYVCRTNKTFCSGNLVADLQFGQTAYVKETGLKSVMSMPVAYQDETVAFLYLENQHIENTFTQERFPVIRLLANQIAAAIERTRLRRELVQEIENRKSKEGELRNALNRLNELKNSLDEENAYLKEEIRNSHGFKDIVGQSPALKKTLYLVEQVVAFDTTTLVLGESGTGKELIARSIHELGPRKNHPIIKVNCAALPATLIESELFGFEKGAFTGAVKPKKGRFLLADGGTLFLDEIGDMPMEVQVKLLRVLQEGTFEPLGSDRTVKVDVRVVAATNRDLEAAIRKGDFREDLYYRLSIFPIHVPPLRERKEDIPLLVNYFIDKKNKVLNKNIKKVPNATLNTLTAYDWPGNIRELENTIERAIILSPGATLVLDEGFAPSGDTPQFTGDTRLENIIREHISHVLAQCNWRVKGKGNAAEKLGLNPSTLRSKMKKLGISSGGGQ